MAELNIKKKIGNRIFESRQAKGLTLKALGELAGGFKQTRLTNWEQGIRAPGPEEVKQLAEVLDVSPAYLMGLSDEKQFKGTRNPSQLIPLLNPKLVYETKLHAHAVFEEPTDLVFISVSTALLPELSRSAFALKVEDDSMVPEIRVNDVLIIDPAILPRPGNYVAVTVESKSEVVICQYKKLSYTSSDFDLLTLNDNWPNITANEKIGIKIIGTVIQNIRKYNQ